MEVVAAWRRMAEAGLLDAGRAELAIADLRALPLERVRHEPLLERCWQLRANVTTYDATYVALAERTGSTLVTADATLAAAPGPRCEIELLS